MQTQVMLGWGEAPLVVDPPAGATVLEAPRSPAGRSWEALFEAAFDPPTQARIAAARSICLLVPDETRKPVAAHLLPLLAPALAGKRVSIGVATGKHPVGPSPVGAWRHDAHDPALVEVGTTAEGTRVAFPRAVLDADLRLLIGEIRPHYFAGYAGGAKTLFPGVAGAEGIWANHRLKARPGAAPGNVETNPCRADMEAAAALAGPSVIFNVIRGDHGAPVDLVAGDVIAAHRIGVARARAIFEIPHPGRRFARVVVSDRAPVTASLYQACKLLIPAGALLAPGGTVILAAACYEGVGPVEVINQGIWALGVRHHLPPGAEVVLVSTRPEASVAPTFARWAPDLAHALVGVSGDALAILPHAGDLIVRGGRPV